MGESKHEREMEGAEVNGKVKSGQTVPRPVNTVCKKTFTLLRERIVY